MEEDVQIVFTGEWPDQKKLLDELIALDYASFGNMDIADEGTAEDWVAIRKACFAHALVQNKRIIGYIDLIALTERGIEVLQEGRLHDGLLKEYADIPQVDPLRLYVVVLAILPEYRRKGWARALWNTSRAYFQKHGKDVTEIYATVWTEEGMHFFRKLGAERIATDTAGHPVLRITPLETRLPEIS